MVKNGAEMNFFTVKTRIFDNRYLVGYILEFANNPSLDGYYSVEETSTLLNITGETLSRRSFRMNTQKLADMSAKHADVKTAEVYLKNLVA